LENACGVVEGVVGMEGGVVCGTGDAEYTPLVPTGRGNVDFERAMVFFASASMPTSPI
jgi:hypothetical protein